MEETHCQLIFTQILIWSQNEIQLSEDVVMRIPHVFALNWIGDVKVKIEFN